MFFDKLFKSKANKLYNWTDDLKWPEFPDFPDFPKIWETRYTKTTKDEEPEELKKSEPSARNYSVEKTFHDQLRNAHVLMHQKRKSEYTIDEGTIIFLLKTKFFEYTEMILIKVNPDKDIRIEFSTRGDMTMSIYENKKLIFLPEKKGVSFGKYCENNNIPIESLFARALIEII